MAYKSALDCLGSFTAGMVLALREHRTAFELLDSEPRGDGLSYMDTRPWIVLEPLTAAIRALQTLHDAIEDDARLVRALTDKCGPEPDKAPAAQPGLEASGD